jgi:hypothetical protein
VLYASTTVAGGFQTAVPVAPNNIVQVAAVINKSINQGVIFIRPSFGSNINQDEGVKIVSPTTGQLLQLQSNGLWENKTKAQVLGGTSSQFVKGDGSLDSNVYALNSALANYQLTSEKAQPNGYASLDSNGKVPLVQINDALIGNVNFQGLWNASTNTPTLANPPASGTKGYYYIVSTAGTFAGISFEVGDWIISNGTAWGKVDNTDAVSSVFGRTGNVTATNGDYNTSQVTELTNLYYTEARVNANTNVAANTAARHNAVTLGTANGLSLSTQQLSLGLASAGVTGALSGTDWSTFNSKQPAGNYVTTDTAQTITGVKTFSQDIIVNSVEIGRGSGNVSSNTSVGVNSLEANTTGSFNTSIGSETLNKNTTGFNNTAVGRVALGDNTTGNNNTAFGNLALYLNTTGSQNTGIGYSALGGITTGINNVAVGHIAGNLINSGADNMTSSNSVYLGHDTRASASGNSNEIVIGHEGRGNGSNTVTIGNSSITNNYFTGNIRGGAFIKSGGTSAQFLKADGSVDSTSYGTGSVTSVAALTLGTTGTDLSSTVANGTTTPVITLNVPTASAANRGALSAADWTTFNGKENAITAGTTAQYYRGDKTFQTLNTSVVPELTNLYYTDARSRAAISLTTTGASGSSTYDNTTGVLNVPTYTLSGLGGIGGTLALGQVAFGTAANTVGGDATFIFDSTNVNLGIGSATAASIDPTITSVVIRDVGVKVLGSKTGVLAFQTNDGSFIPTFADGITGEIYSISENASGSVYGLGFLTSTISGANRAERWRITSTGILQSNGAQIIQTSTGVLTIQPTGGVNLATSSGNVGIGSVAPTVKLEVNTGIGNSAYFTRTAADYGITSPAFAILNDSSSPRLYSFGTGMEFWTAPVGGTITQRWEITSAGILQSNGAQTIQTSTGNLTLATAAGNGNILLTPNGTGNVGIGTNSPSGKLSVVNNGGLPSTTALLNLTNQGAALNIDITSATSGNSGFVNLTSTSGGTGQAASAGFLFTTRNLGTTSEKVRITSGGNVGIGTASPSNILTVVSPAGGSETISGNFRSFSLLHANQAGSPGLRLGYNESSKNAIISGVEQGGGTGGGVEFWSFNGSAFAERMRITSGGNLDMSANSDINFGGSGKGIYLSRSGLGPRASLTTRLNVNWVDIANSSDWNGVTLAASGGNVLIGTTSDAGFKLDVSGTGRFSSTVTATNGLFVSGTNQNTIGGGSLSLINFSAYNSSANQSITLGLALDTAVNNNAAYNYLFNVGGNADGQSLTLSSRRNGIADLTILTVNGNNGASTFASTLTANGITSTASVSTPHTTKSANYTLDATDYTVGFDCASNRTATLPDATTCAGRIYVIYQYNTGSGTRSVTLDGNGSQTINGVTTYSLAPYCDFTSVVIQSNGSNWIIISSNLTADCL